jgi:hypothetical protein
VDRAAGLYQAARWAGWCGTRQECETMSEQNHIHAATRTGPADEAEEAFEGLVEAMGVLLPEALTAPDAWLALSDTGSLQPMASSLARIPILSERWD